MSTMNAFRSLALAAVMTASLGASAAPAERAMVPPGATAYGAWVPTTGRTPLASMPISQGQAALKFLEDSGATGGDGQHA
ncbi:hypothetical protein [Roseomonas populi]|uniref:Uncharacterized protein n=1 Tax=Roseomonas populi TaxID=3121582 RepID=A0ABT1X6Q2_9PROT|nr:hypothetical protein [Roseomonas pecuniae]MCR0983790.1 hypothetical protein [Roseomonas pecuniae]